MRVTHDGRVAAEPTSPPGRTLPSLLTAPCSSLVSPVMPLSASPPASWPASSPSAGAAGAPGAAPPSAACARCRACLRGGGGGRGQRQGWDRRKPRRHMGKATINTPHHPPPPLPFGPTCSRLSTACALEAAQTRCFFIALSTSRSAASTSSAAMPPPPPPAGTRCPTRQHGGRLADVARGRWLLPAWGLG